MTAVDDEVRLRPAAVAAWSAMALVAAVAALLAQVPGGRGDAVRPRVAPPACRIDLSTAPVEELALLPEVGPSLAARIAADRAVRGPFASVDELTRVRGIGERTLAQLRGDARVSSP